jgi:hypothetical protein
MILFCLFCLSLLMVQIGKETIERSAEQFLRLYDIREIWCSLPHDLLGSWQVNVNVYQFKQNPYHKAQIHYIFQSM